MRKISKTFQPINVIPKNASIKNQNMTSRSQKLMMELGLIRSTANGSYHILPILQKSIEKCIDLVDYYMKKIDGQKMTMPLLTAADLWKKSGRYCDTNTAEIMTTKDRHDKLQILSPTHEESVTALLASIAPNSYKNFPLRLYQIGSKFRDEFKPRFGLIRGREFIMKDLYTFDISTEEATKTYQDVSDAYEKILKAINVPFVKCEADTGIMGGSISHEYHFPAAIGEDNLSICEKCGRAANTEVMNSNKSCSTCLEDGNHRKSSMGIEVAHTFILNDKYSKILGASYLNATGKTRPLIMGCYGIGISRIIPAALEVLSTETELRWPFKLAPYKIIIIPPKQGSREASAAQACLEKLYYHLNNSCHDDVIVDDRINMTIGKRVLEAKRMGYPIIVVLGSKITEENPKFELISTETNVEEILSYDELLSGIHRIFSKHNLFS